MSKLLTGLDPLPRATLSEQVAKQLAARITAGDWKPGEKLPSEAELCRAFHVGRSSLREALTSLAFIGLIRVRAGGGSYVAEQPSAYYTSSWLNTGTLNNGKALADFIEARMVLESELAGICAERITQEEIDDLSILVEKMKLSADDASEFWKLDLAFHLSMGRAAKNEVLNDILKNVREQMRDLISKSLLLKEGMEQAVVHHIRILESLRQHNATRARNEMRTHLQSFQRGYMVLLEDQTFQSRT